MKNKKVVALLLAAIMALGCLTGCGNEKLTQSSEVETQTQKESESVATESTEVVELEEKTIQIWLAGPGKQKDSDKVWEEFNKKLQEYVPNTTVEFTVIPFAEYGENFNRMLAAEEKVDLAWVGYATKLAADVQDGNLMPLDDLLAEYGQGIVDTIGTELIDMNRYTDGKLYYTISWQGAIGNKYAFWMPTELVELAGEGWVEDTQAAVDKWWGNELNADNLNAVFDQFEKYLAACKDAGKLYSGIKPYNSFAVWNGQKGVDRRAPIVNNVGIARTPDNEWIAIDCTQNEEKRVVAQRWSEFYEKGYIRSDIASVDKSTLKFVENGEYNSNTVVMWSHELVCDGAEITNAAKAGTDLTFIYREPVGTLSKGDATAMAVPYSADDPERAIMVLNALYTEPELYQLLIYGIEGEHYTTNADGTITTPYGAEGNAEADYGLTRWTIGTCMNSLVTQNDTADYYPSLLRAQETAKINPFATFVFDKTNVADICTALAAVDGKYELIVDGAEAGANCEALLDEWIKERKAVGVDKLVEEYQRQIDEFIKANNITSW